MRRTGFRPRTASLRSGGNVVPFPGRSRQGAGSGNRRRGSAVPASGTRSGTGKGRPSLSGSGSGMPGSAGRKPRPSATGPSPRTRELVLKRDEYRCVICGISIVGRVYSLHHRRNRAAGGSRHPAINSPVNLLTVCGSGVSLCHGQITRNVNRLLAIAKGWVVPVNGIPERTDPALIPVQVAWLGKRWATPDGRWSETPPAREGREPEDDQGGAA